MGEFYVVYFLGVGSVFKLINLNVSVLINKVFMYFFKVV